MPTTTRTRRPSAAAHREAASQTAARTSFAAAVKAQDPAAAINAYCGMRGLTVAR